MPTDNNDCDIIEVSLSDNDNDQSHPKSPVKKEKKKRLITNEQLEKMRVHLIKARAIKEQNKQDKLLESTKGKHAFLRQGRKLKPKTKAELLEDEAAYINKIDKLKSKLKKSKSRKPKKYDTESDDSLTDNESDSSDSSDEEPVVRKKKSARSKQPNEKDLKMQMLEAKLNNLMKHTKIGEKHTKKPATKKSVKSIEIQEEQITEKPVISKGISFF